MNTKGIGEVSEGIVLAHLLKSGRTVLLPFGNNQRYDLVVDEDGTFVRVQVKTGRLERGCVVFNTSSVNGFTGKRTTYAGTADVFMVYCPATGGVYRVPVAECGASMMSLRVDPAAKNWSTIHWAKDYLVELDEAT